MNKHTALIVDDEPDIRDLLEITLSRMGINTLTAKDVSTAKSLFRAQTPAMSDGYEPARWQRH